jgi:hypothetical protein
MEKFFGLDVLRRKFLAAAFRGMIKLVDIIKSTSRSCKALQFFNPGLGTSFLFWQ